MRILMCLFAFFSFGILTLGGSITAETELLWDLGGSPVWKGKLSAGLAHPAGTTELSLLLDGHGLRELGCVDRGRLGPLEYTGALSFSPKGLEISSLALGFPWSGLEIRWVGVVERKGAGWGLEVRGGHGFLEGVRARWNLKPFSHRVVDGTFSPHFTYGEARFSLDGCGGMDLRGHLTVTNSGFQELSLRFPLPLWDEPRVGFAMRFKFGTQHNELEARPGLQLKFPACVEAFIRVRGAKNTIEGLELYGLGFHGGGKGWEFRGLLETGEVDLVPGRGTLSLSFCRVAPDGKWRGRGEVILADPGGLLAAEEVRVAWEWTWCLGEFSFSVELAAEKAPTIKLGTALTWETP